MAAQIVLVRGATTVSLQGGIDGIWLADNGWIRTVAQRGVNGQWPESVPETLVCRVQADDQDDLAAIIQSVNEILRQAGDYADEEIDYNEVYLRAQLKDESNAYQALILSGTAEPRSSLYDPPVDYDDFLPEIVISLTRKWAWEPTSSTNITATEVDAAGDLYNYSASAPAGDVPGRPSYVRFDEETGGDMDAMAEHWLGFRTARFGTIANFEPVWSLEDAGSLDNNTADMTTYIRWSPAGGADDLLLTRAVISMGDAVTYPADQRGRFLVLLRAKSSSAVGTRTFHVKVASGLAEGSTWDERPRVLISGGDFYFYAVGEFSFPVIGRPIGYSDAAMMREQALRIRAEIADEGDSDGNLDMERLVLIPIAEGFMHIKSAETIGSVGDWATMFTEPDDSIASVLYILDTHQYPEGLPAHDTAKWGLPPEAGAMVYAGQDTGESRTTDELRILVSYYERWLTLKGAG